MGRAGAVLQDILPNALRGKPQKLWQRPSFPLIFINQVMITRDQGPHGRRRSTTKNPACAHCGRKFKIEPLGRLQTYWSASCRSLAFAKNNRKVKVSPEDPQRLRTWELLKDAGFVHADMPLPPRRRRSTIRATPTSYA